MESLKRYTRYNAWANSRLLTFIAENCSAEHLTQKVPGSFPDIRTTWLHIWGAESVWYLRLNGTSPTEWRWMEYKKDFRSLSAEILTGNDQWLKMIEPADQAWFDQNLEYSSISGQHFSTNISDIILHCFNHSTYHRGQVITQLHQVGFEKLIPTDFIKYCRPSQ
ncbi:MAG: DinB family protein [Bacteroidia bacterium]|nr:DinB family protein [Bacteroidia bacterium]